MTSAPQPSAVSEASFHIRLKNTKRAIADLDGFIMEIKNCPPMDPRKFRRVCDRLKNRIQFILDELEAAEKLIQGASLSTPHYLTLEGNLKRKTYLK